MVYVGQARSSSDLYLLLGDGACGLDGVGAPVHELGHGVAGLQVEGADAAAAVDRHAVALVPPGPARLHDELEALELHLLVRVEDILQWEEVMWLP